MMKKKLLLKVALCLSFFVLFATMRYATASAMKLDGSEELKSDVTYKLDLDGDGKKEKLRMHSDVKADGYSMKLILYVNGKKVYSKTLSGYSSTLKVCDIDKKDKYLDLFYYATEDSDCVTFITLFQYREGKLRATYNPKQKAKNELLKYIDARIKGISTSGNGKFDIISDTPAFLLDVGSYYCKIPFQQKDGKVVCLKPQYYRFCNSDTKSASYKYKLKNKGKLYSKASKSSKSIILKKGTKLNIIKIGKLSNGKVVTPRIYIKTTKGKKGWMLLSKNSSGNLFTNSLGWG